VKAVRGYWLVGTFALVAGCVPQPAAPPPPPPPAPVRMLPPPPRPAPPPVDWQDIPLSAGDWSYRDEGAASSALFGLAGQPSLVLRCDKGSHQVTLSLPGMAGGPAMTVRTSFGARTFALSAQSAPAATLGAADPFLDSIAFSRGRFTIETKGMAMLVIPSWAEPARLIEDCRG
jgi:hypothetical protein